MTGEINHLAKKKNDLRASEFSSSVIVKIYQRIINVIPKQLLAVNFFKSLVKHFCRRICSPRR